MEIVERLPHEIKRNVMLYLSTPIADIVRNIDYEEEFKKRVVKQYLFAPRLQKGGSNQLNVFGYFIFDYDDDDDSGGLWEKTKIITFDMDERWGIPTIPLREKFPFIILGFNTLDDREGIINYLKVNKIPYKKSWKTPKLITAFLKAEI